MENSSREASSQRFRPLLPQPFPLAQSFAKPDAQRHGKSARTKLACDSCRLNKVKCSGERPICNECIKRSSRCHYERDITETKLQGLKRKVSELETRRSPREQLFDTMKSLPKHDAHKLLDKIRFGADIDMLASHVADGHLLLQLSVVPETRYRYDFPYRSSMPASLITNNPYLESFVYEAAAMYSSPGHTRRPQTSQVSPESNLLPHSNDAERTFSGTVYQTPFHAAVVIEPRLFQADISYWTSICQDNELMRSLLSAWLHCEYHFTAILQKDLFLEDMLLQRQDFCSPLLVNIVLGYACICYPQLPNRAHYWDPQTLTYRFLAEAKRLWELEAHEPRITTIQAGILFNVFYNLSGLDQVGQVYRIQAIALAKSMRLFNHAAFEGQSARILHGMAYTAWALFNWETLVGFSFMFAPLLSESPDWRLPDPATEPQWYGEIWVRYPLSNYPLPMYFSQVFEARSRFRIIMNKVCQATYSKDSKLSLAQANNFLSQLKSWFASLPAALLPKHIVLPGHLQLHMYYHHLILTIFRPLLDVEGKQEPSVQHILDDASKFLQTLVRLYYLRHGFEAMDLFIVIPLVLTAYDCIEAIDERTSAPQLESLRSTLILVAKGLYSQRKNHHLAKALFQVVRGRMRPAEVSLFKGTLNLNEAELVERPDMAQAVRSHWPVTVVKNRKDVDAYMLANLVDEYAHLNVEDEPA